MRFIFTVRLIAALLAGCGSLMVQPVLAQENCTNFDEMIAAVTVDNATFEFGEMSASGCSGYIQQSKWGLNVRDGVVLFLKDDTANGKIQTFYRVTSITQEVSPKGEASISINTEEGVSLSVYNDKPPAYFVDAEAYFGDGLF